MLDVLVVGQTPPPYHGQAIMIEAMLDGAGDKVRMHHVRMHFSKVTGEVGRFQVGKLFHLFVVVMKIYFYRFRYGTKTLYYPPAGADKVPFFRDVVILLLTRFLFKRVVFHFHAAGVSELYDRLPGVLRFFYRRCYFYPDAALRLSEYNPGDPAFLKAKREWIVPNGVADHCEKGFKRDVSVASASSSCRMLYVGALQETKGILVLVEACRILNERGLVFDLHLVGGWESPEFEALVREKVESYELGERVIFEGVLSGEEKFEQYRRAEVFCYPTFYECETFGIVLLEAMQFSEVVVAAKWRGVRSVVRDGETGFLVKPKDAEALAGKLEQLIRDPELRQRMQQAGRERYLKEYTLEIFNQRMQEVFLSLN